MKNSLFGLAIAIHTPQNTILSSPDPHPVSLDPSKIAVYRKKFIRKIISRSRAALSESKTFSETTGEES
jgi:hypothetical protein